MGAFELIGASQLSSGLCVMEKMKEGSYES